MLFLNISSTGNNMKSFRTEDNLQAACVAYWQQYRFTSYLFAVPNGGNRDPKEAAKLKATGTKAGVFDLVLMLPAGRCVFIEMKNGQQNQLRPVQQAFQGKAKMLGFETWVCFTYENFVELVDTLLVKYYDKASRTIKAAGVPLLPNFTFSPFDDSQKEGTGEV